MLWRDANFGSQHVLKRPCILIPTHLCVLRLKKNPSSLSPWSRINWLSAARSLKIVLTPCLASNAGTIEDGCSDMSDISICRTSCKFSSCINEPKISGSISYFYIAELCKYCHLKFLSSLWRNFVTRRKHELISETSSKVKFWEKHFLRHIF